MNHREPRSLVSIRMVKVRILLVEDSEDDAHLLLRSLQKKGVDCDVLRVADRDGMRSALEESWDIVLADFALPGFGGFEALQLTREVDQDLPFILISGTIGEDLAVEAMRSGAQDYIMKDNLTRLLPALEREVNEYQNRKHRADLLKRLRANEEQLKAASLIQRDLFPRQAPDLSSFEIAGESFPAEATGGDYYDFIPMDAGRLSLVIGDVSGHGFGPALLMAATRSYLRAFCQNTRKPGEILFNTNRVLHADVRDRPRFVTLILGIVDPVDMSLTYASAGHHYGYIIDQEGRARVKLASTGLPLGIFDNSTYYSPEKIQLEPGDLVLLLTDGVSEARSVDGRTFGIARALETVHEHRSLSAAEIVGALYRAVVGFSNGLRREDDITAVVMKVK